jgi:hypothetical protein
MPLPSGSDNGSLSLNQPLLQLNVSGISEGLQHMEVGPSRISKGKDRHLQLVIFIPVFVGKCKGNCRPVSPGVEMSNVWQGI